MTMNQEIGWLIEFGEPVEGEGPKWWTGAAVLIFSEDVNQACRFAREEDALRVVNGMLDGVPTVATEHTWDDGLDTYAEEELDKIGSD